MITQSIINRRINQLKLLAIFIFIVSISKGQSNFKKETDFKNYIETLPELTNGYTFKECKHIITIPDTCDKNNVKPMNGSEYIYLQASTKIENKLETIIPRNILGYVMGQDGSVVIVTVNRYKDDDVLEINTPALLLYNKKGEKIASLNLTRNECFNMPSFTINKQTFFRNYSCNDTIKTTIDENGNELDSVKIVTEAKAGYFEIGFDNSGFILIYKDGIKCKFHEVFGESPLEKFSRIYGEIGYPNGSAYKGPLSADIYGATIGDNYEAGEFKNGKGNIIKGIFSGDTILCKFPKVYLGKLNLGEPQTNAINPPEITIEDFIKCENISVEDGKILGFDILVKTSYGIKEFSINGSSLKEYIYLINAKKEIKSGSKIYIDSLKILSKKGKISAYNYCVKVK
jgi:hypothetical protein